MQSAKCKVIRAKERYVILSEHSEPKDLGTDFTAKVNELRRSFDSAGAPLRMTGLFFVRIIALAGENG